MTARVPERAQSPAPRGRDRRTAHFAWAATPALTLSLRARVSPTSTLSGRRAVSRWLLGGVECGPRLDAQRLGEAWLQQLPELRYRARRTAARSNLSPERASYVDVGG